MLVEQAVGFGVRCGCCVQSSSGRCAAHAFWEVFKEQVTLVGDRLVEVQSGSGERV